jgi:hypothetical protein
MTRYAAAIAAATVAGLLIVAPAYAIYGTQPLAISLWPGHGAPNGPSGHPRISGDGRVGRFTAFDSEASNLVRSDTNHTSDVFVWRRPRGRAGLTLSHPGGALKRVSVSSSGHQANGPSSRPAVDGSIFDNSPHCVAFQSEASNLAPGDHDHRSDIFVRDMGRDRTTLVSRGIAAAATDATIDGTCEHVAFAAGGGIYIASVNGGPPRRIASGSDPRYALDGSAITWTHGGDVWLRRGSSTSLVGPGTNPTVSSDDEHTWAVSFETTRQLSHGDNNHGSDVYMRIFGTSGGARKTDLISATHRGGRSLGGDSYNGGITAYGGSTGIVVFVNDTDRGSDLYYRNNRSGNIDDLAHSSSRMTQVTSSARANFVAFTSRGEFTGNTDGQQAVFFKHLVDGKALP